MPFHNRCFEQTNYLVSIIFFGRLRVKINETTKAKPINQIEKAERMERIDRRNETDIRRKKWNSRNSEKMSEYASVKCIAFKNIVTRNISPNFSVSIILIEYSNPFLLHLHLLLLLFACIETETH